jgi:hypothetical protein
MKDTIKLILEDVDKIPKNFHEDAEYEFIVRVEKYRT